MKKIPKKASKVISDKEVISTLRKMFKLDPELKELAPYIGGGLKTLFYLLNATEAAETVEAPQGIKIKAVEVGAKNPKSKKARGEIAVANILMDKIFEQLRVEGY